MKSHVAVIINDVEEQKFDLEVLDLDKIEQSACACLAGNEDPNGPPA